MSLEDVSVISTACLPVTQLSARRFSWSACPCVVHLSSGGLYDDQAIGCYCTCLMANSHRHTVPRESAFGELAREDLGLPRQGRGNVQTPHGHRAGAGGDGRIGGQVT